jgi:peptidoglycan/xylan/chitin deacetylase (PgdA/CDA1 family)
LNRYGFKATIFAVTNAIGLHNTWDDGKPVPKIECLNLDEIKTMIDFGWEIGSHTNTHAELQTLTPDELKNEVQGSKIELEKLLKIKIKSFCYPYGGCNDAVRNAVVDAGYTSACVISADTGSVTDDLFRLKRVFVKPEDSLFTFKRKIAPWYLMLRGIRKR